METRFEKQSQTLMKTALMYYAVRAHISFGLPHPSALVEAQANREARLCLRESAPIRQQRNALREAVDKLYALKSDPRHASARRSRAVGEPPGKQPPMNTNPENFPPFKGRAPHAGSWNPNARSLRKFLGGIFSLLTIWLSLGHAAQSVTLAWDPSSDPNLAGFKVHFRAIAGSPRQSLNVGKTTTTKVSNLSDGTTYYFTVTAYDNWGHESGPSNEVSYKTAALGAHKLTVRDGSGSGQYTEGKRVIVTADKPAPGQEFDRWTGDWQILDNFLSPTTSALMLFRDLSITASYRGSEAIRYRPLTGFTERMVGGVFEGTDGDPVTGPYISHLHDQDDPANRLVGSPCEFGELPVFTLQRCRGFILRRGGDRVLPSGC